MQPLMQALLAARIQEEPTAFGKWCIQNNVRSLPAAPSDVAAFVRDFDRATPEIWEAVSQVSQMHLANGLADPTAGGIVSKAMNDIAKIDPPRSWPHSLLPRFYSLPYDLQDYLSKRDKEQRKEISRAHNEAAIARQALAKSQQPEKTEDGIQQDTAA